MKKILLFAALAAASLSMSAQYTVEKLWGSTNVPAAADCRQGVGMNGKFYINNKYVNADEGAEPQVLVYSENGLENQQFEGGLNCGINIDQAGHLIVSLATFPNANSWLFDDETPMIRVIDPVTGNVTDLPLGGGAPNGGRLDVLGRAYGDLLGTGELYLPLLPANGGINRYFYEEGEVLGEDCYAALQSPSANADNMTIVNAVVDADGNDAIFYYQRGGMPYLFYWNGDNLEGQIINIPASENGMIRCNQNGADFFAFDGKNFVVYPCGAANNAYYDGFAIYEIGAEAPLFVKEPTIATAPNAFQANWLNAELTNDGVIIYQYVPGKSMEVYKMALENDEPETRTISGGVRDTEGNPIEGVLVTAVLAVEEQPEGLKRADGDTYTATTDANGYYEVEVPAEGEYMLTFEKEGYVSQTLPEMEAEAVTLEADTNTGVSDVNSAKAVASVKYVNAAGQVSTSAFTGVNVMVTTYSDGSQSIVKVVK